MQMLLDNFFYYQSYLKIATPQTAAGACTTCFEWAHLSLELEWHKKLLVTFRASPIFLIILLPVKWMVYSLCEVPLLGLECDALKQVEKMPEAATS